MIHGPTKLELSYASVREALQDYVRKHVAIDVNVTILKWSSPYVVTAETQAVQLEFEQHAPLDPFDRDAALAERAALMAASKKTEGP